MRMLSECLLNLTVQVFGIQRIHRLATQIEHGLDRRQYTMSPRFGQQGAVVTDTKITIAAAQIDHLDILLLEVVLAGQVVVRMDHLRLKFVKGPVGQIFHHNDLCGHVFAPWRRETIRAARSPLLP